MDTDPYCTPHILVADGLLTTLVFSSIQFNSIFKLMYVTTEQCAVTARPSLYIDTNVAFSIWTRVFHNLMH